MVNDVTVEITLRDNKTGDYLTVPVLPPVIEYVDGAAQAHTVQILNLGDVDFPSGVELDTVSWASFFPARYDPSYCTTARLLTPIAYRNRISGWKDAHTPLQLIIPAAGINKTMTVANFPWEYGEGFEGDIYYSITLKEHKSIRPKKLTPQGTVPPRGKKQPAERPAAPVSPKPSTYTVQPGDTLTLIGKRLGIPWNTIYQNNRDVIGANPNIIRPGQVLTL